MSNVFTPAGNIIAAPGPVGSPAVIQFADVGDPNVRSDPDSMLRNCAIGSVYHRIDLVDSTHQLYVKTGLPNTWTAK